MSLKSLNIKYLSCFLLALSLHAEEKTRRESLHEESTRMFEKSVKIASLFYSLEKEELFKEMTHVILESQSTSDLLKKEIVSSGRRFILFQYPSDGFQIKGYLSFIPNSKNKPLLLLLRGGNRILGLMHPATDLTCVKDYTVLMTSYRGGVSEGKDEFGGEEVNDVENLLKYLPNLEEQLHVEFAPSPIFLLGASRGGMEMFLALGRSLFLQEQVAKAVSLSGLLDLKTCIHSRPDMKNMFIHDFGLIPCENEEEWIATRNPLCAAPKIRSDLPIFIIQGTQDLRVCLEEGINMVNVLKNEGHCVEYLEVPEGSHCLNNKPDRMQRIVEWLEK